MTFSEALEKRVIVFDGGFGTMVQPFMQQGELPELLSLRLPEKVRAVHAAYLDAGCDVIETNTLNANRRKLARAGHTVDEVISASVACARQAVAGCGREAYVALSMGSTGVMLEPLGDLGFSEACDIFAEMAAAGERAGADIILIETMNDLMEVKAAVTGARRATKLPVAVTVTFMGNGRMLTGADPRTAAVAIQAMGADIIGMNCGMGPAQMVDIFGGMASAAVKPVLVNPNAGMPRLVNGASEYSVAADEFAREASQLVKMGARLIGGCCGTTPAHISALKAAINGLTPSATGEKGTSAITGGSRIFELDGSDSICDPGSEDMDDIADEAAETESGAIIVRGGDDLPDKVRELQETVLLPMYLVSDDTVNLREAVRIYNGKPLIGIADMANASEYIDIARACGAAVAASDEATRQIIAETLGEDAAFTDDGTGKLTRSGISAAAIDCV